MSTSLEIAVESYLRARNLSRGTRNEYASTIRKWKQWGPSIPIEDLSRKDIREFLDRVQKEAIAGQGTNPGRTANKARENLRAVMSWAWEQDLLETLPRFPPPKDQRDVAGRHYLTKAELNALYFATYQLKKPRGWSEPLPIGTYWRSALVLFFNYGMDTGTIWKSTPIHEPILWRHVSWDKCSPDGRQKDRSRWGWIFFRRVKTQKSFYRPMNRVVHEHLRNIKPDSPPPNDPVFRGGGCRPNSCFVSLCNLAGIRPKQDLESGKEIPWHIKDLRKTCATYYDEHIPESSVEILGHAVGGNGRYVSAWRRGNFGCHGPFTPCKSTTVVLSPFSLMTSSSSRTETISPSRMAIESAVDSIIDRKVSTPVTMDVDVPENTNGVLYAPDFFSGGVTCCIKDGMLCYEFNLFEIQRTRIKSEDTVVTGKRKIEIESKLVDRIGGPIDIIQRVDGLVVGQGRVPAAMSLHFTSNATFDIGTGLDSPVSLDYYDQAPFQFNGTIGGATIIYLDR